MRRLWGSLLLAFCLVSSQQAALLHELSHFAQRSGTLQSAEAGTQPVGADRKLSQLCR